MTKTCIICKKTKELNTDNFYYNRNAKFESQKWEYRCRDCMRKVHRENNRTPKRKLYNKAHQKRLQKQGYFKEYNQIPENKKKSAEYQKKRRLDPKQKIKNFARDFLKKRKNSGRIIQQPCVICEKNPTQAHHLDYNKPLLIIWLCVDCHRKEHQRLRSINYERKVKD